MGRNVSNVSLRSPLSHGRSLALVLFVLLFSIAVFAVAVPAISTAGTIDSQVRRAAQIELCGELKGLIDHWEGDVDGYIASSEGNRRHDLPALEVRITSGTKLTAPLLKSLLPAQFQCKAEVALAERNGIAQPIFFETRGGDSQLIGARIEEEQSSGGVRWVDIRIDMGGTLEAAFHSQLVLAFATLAMALVLGGLAARLIGRQLQQSVAAVNLTLTAFAHGDQSKRVSGDPRDAVELIDLKTHVNAALGDIARQTEARKTAAEQIVHDIRSPLGKVEMWLRPHANVDAKIARALSVVTDVIDGTRQILLGLTGDLSKERRLLLSQVFAGHTEDYRVLAEAQGIAFAVSISPGIVVLGTEANVNRLLGNLVQNVIDHGEAGIAKLDLRSDGGGFRLTIENDCRDMPKAGNPAGNFGLGQASVRNIVAQQGWTFASSVADGRYRIVVTGPIAPDL